MSRPYASAAALYRRAGWRDVIPVRGKNLPAVGFTGREGRAVADADLAGWMLSRAGDNVGLRLVDVIGIDVDCYGNKIGEQSLGKAEAELGQLERTWSSTSRGPDQPSRIRLYALPAGCDMTGAEDRLRKAFGAGEPAVSDIEILHFGHRYALAWPSVHPDTGLEYRWYDSAGQLSARVPSVDELPGLPVQWLKFLLTGERPVAEQVDNPFTSPALPGATWTPGERPFTLAAAEKFIGPALGRFEALGEQGNGRSMKLFNLGTLMHHFADVAGFWTADEAQARLYQAAETNGFVAVHGTTNTRVQIRNGLKGDKRDPWKATFLPSVPAPPQTVASDAPADTQRPSRRVALRGYLDGSYVAPTPSVGIVRTDGVRLLYPGRWHSVVGLTGAAKSWLAVQHAVVAMGAGLVVYCHFEEASPGGTLARLQALGCSPDFIEQQFVWLDCSMAWSPGQFATELAELSSVPVLTVFDGITAACTRHGWLVDKPEAVGAYRDMFVTPATRLGTAVLSCGHPPKGRDRQDERHGYGASGWLDEVDGVGFRMIAGRPAIRKGQSGFSNLYSVKDRYGEVETHGQLADGRDGWYYLGAFVVDDTAAGFTRAWLAEPKQIEAQSAAANPNSALGQQIAEHLGIGGEYASENLLSTSLKAAGLKFSNDSMKAALEWLEMVGQLERPAYEARKARPGKLISKSAPDADLEDDEHDL